MKILVLAPHPYYIDRGTPIDVDLVVRALSERGDDVDLVVYHNGEDRAYPGMSLHRTRAPKWLSALGPGFSVKKVLADCWLFARAWRLVRTRRYDVIHAGEEAVFFAMWFRMVHGVPYIYDMDSSIAQQMIEKMPWLRPLARFFNWCEATAIRGAVAVAPVCHALRNLAEQRGARYVCTLHDISQMTPESFQAGESIRERLGLRGLVLMYVGNLERYQGIDLLLEAFAIVVRRGVEMDLVIAGGTTESIRRYEDKGRRLGIAELTHFIGPWPAARLGELLCQADILTAPRIKGINTPMKVFPYLHSGRPLLVTDLYTHTQILTDEVAELAPAEPNGFAEAIAKLARDPERRRQLGEAGRRFVDQGHTYAAHRDRMDGLYGYVERQLDAGKLRPGLVTTSDSAGS